MLKHQDGRHFCSTPIDGIEYINPDKPAIRLMFGQHDFRALFEGVARQEIAGALVEVNAANRAQDETVEAFLRRTMLPAMRVVETHGRGAIARPVRTEWVRFPALVEIYRREMLDPLLVEMRKLVKAAKDEGELASDAPVRRPERLIAPIGYGIIHNGLLDRSQPLDIGDLFEANLNLLFGR